MSYAIVYSSETGNTKLLADEIQRTLPHEDCLYCGKVSKEALAAHRIYIGFWTDKGSCDETSGQFLEALTDQEVFLFGTAGFGQDAGYYDKVIAHACRHIPDTAHVTGHFMCQGKMRLSVRQRYVKMKDDHPEISNIQDMIDNFDAAMSHPDEKDLSDLRAAIHCVL